ncbi:MAG: hypothetical protein AAFV07_03655 [Bacteroidota bacterium]
MRHLASTSSLIFSFLLFCCSLWTGCGLLPMQFATHSAPDQSYSLRVPSDLTPVTSPDENLILQLGDAYRDFYLALRRDSIAALQRTYPTWDLMDYYDFHMENLVQDIQDAVAPGPDSVVVGGHPALYGIYQGYFKGDPLVFRLAVVEATDHQYQLLMWARQDQAEEMLPLMDSILYSFQTFP